MMDRLCSVGVNFLFQATLDYNLVPFNTREDNITVGEFSINHKVDRNGGCKDTIMNRWNIMDKWLPHDQATHETGNASKNGPSKDPNIYLIECVCQIDLFELQKEVSYNLEVVEHETVFEMRSTFSNARSKCRGKNIKLAY